MSEQFRTVFQALILALLVTLSVPVAPITAAPAMRPLAASTPQQCDSTPKYSCAYIDYTVSGGTRTIHNRYYKGAIDGGAQQWRVEFFIDYKWDGSTWVRTTPGLYGPSAWYTNVTFGVWSVYAGNNTQTTTSARSAALFKYYESNGSSSWYWWSSQYDFIV